jgi:hypothetical protein
MIHSPASRLTAEAGFLLSTMTLPTPNHRQFDSSQRHPIRLN